MRSQEPPTKETKPSEVFITVIRKLENAMRPSGVPCDQCYEAF